MPHSALTIEGLAATDSRLWVLDMDGGPSGCACSPTTASRCLPWSCPPVCAVDDVDPARGRPGGVLGARRSCLLARGGWRPTPRPRPVARRWIRRRRSTSPASRCGACSRRPKDGTQVPISLIARAGALDAGPAPTLLAAYGGYGISIKPLFAPGVCSGSSGAGCSWSRTSAAAASTARSGTTAAGSSPSRTASTTSSPALDTSSRPVSPRWSSWLSAAGPTAGC